MKIYITGASGRLGHAVMKLLPSAISVNLRDESLNLKKTFSNATHVIHLAASLNFEDARELWKSNYELTKRVVNSLPKNCKIVYASSISVYGKRLVEIPATEKTPCHPDSAYAKSKYAAEQEVIKHGNYVALRIAAIYGPGFTDYFKMIDVLRKGHMRIIGDGSNRVPFVHVEDVAKAIKNSLNAKSGIYLLSADSITQRKTFEIVSKELGITTPMKTISPDIVHALLKITKIIRKLTHKGEFLTPEHLNILSKDRVFDCSKAKKELKFKPRKTERGIGEMVKEYLRVKKSMSVVK
ncbi:MAG: NAD(P)-dependent oxidoreductase [Candidatus Micrarchaeota archaeon]|nr:NAD(P)-dependent oxidoreductase [Candidatus Micrarchaeota archaeon]